MKEIAICSLRPSFAKASARQADGKKHWLYQFCYGKGFIEIGRTSPKAMQMARSDFKSIKILQNNKEIKRLQQLFEKAGIWGVEWTE